jgi:hypothetical protein
MADLLIVKVNFTQKKYRIFGVGHDHYPIEFFRAFDLWFDNVNMRIATTAPGQ